MSRRALIAALAMTLSPVAFADPQAADAPATNPPVSNPPVAVPAATSPAPTDAATTAPIAVISPATPEQAQAAVEKALAYLQAESAAWFGTRKCAACHHVPMPIMAMLEAERHGYAINKAYALDTIEASLGSVDKMIAARLMNGPNDPPDTRPLARGVNPGQVFMAVAALSQDSLNDGQRESVKRINEDIIKKQQPDGSWEFFLSRPPINENQVSDTVWMILSLLGQPGHEPSADERAAIEKGMAWLATAQLPGQQQDKALQLLLALRLGKSRADSQPLVDELLAMQRPDGGWGQLPDLPTDAFATGETLYVLSLAGYQADDRAIKRAIDFLVSTQQPDGSWPMKSRSSPDGSTGGSAKLLTPINCGAASWATMSLSRLVPKGS